MSHCCHSLNSNATAVESKDLGRRFWIALLFGVPVIILAMGPMIASIVGLAITGNNLGTLIAWSPWVQFLFTIPLLFWCGWPIWEKGWDSFRSRNLNMFSLVSIGIGVTFFYSCSRLFFSEHGHSVVVPHGHSAMPDLYFEAAAMIMLLVLLGQYLEARGKRKAGAALRELLELVPSKATLLRKGIERKVAVSELKPGDQIRIHPGEKIPVDGIVLEGSSAVDEALLTGESLPVEKSIGAVVSAGTINDHGSFIMRVEKVGNETVIAQMIAMVTAAQESRAPIQNLTDRVAALFVPLIFGVAIITFVAWLLLSPGLGWSFALSRSIAVLLIACPCALGLATPMAVAVGVGTAAWRGILIRDAGVLDSLAAVQLMVFDKTGTLTEGRPEVVALKTVGQTSRESLIALIAAAERGSEHPLAQALLRYAEEQHIIEKKASFFLAEPGGGIRAEVEGVAILVGNDVFLRNHQVEIVDPIMSDDRSIIFVALNGYLEGIVFLSDLPKISANDCIQKLQRLGIEVAMLTGDREGVSRAVAQQLGITRWKASLSPQQKAEQILEWKKEGKLIAMAGDGINDAQALSVADASIAMAAGSNLAKETAGIVLMNSSLEGVVTAVRLSRSIGKTIRQNLFFAFVYNLLGIPVAAGLLYPWLGVTLSPMLATAAMSLSSLSVIGNSLRLRKK